MSHGHFIRAVKEFGVTGTFKKLFKMRTLKFGTYMGTDELGNKYYENKIDYPHGQHRWVEYAGEKSFYENDASNVPASWHGWLHGVTDELPTATTIGSTHRYKPLEIAKGSSAPYERNVGGVIAPHTPSYSSHKPRGYGVGNGLAGGSKPGENFAYTQPGFPLDPRNPAIRLKREPAPELTNSEAMRETKVASRLGMTREEYKAATNPEDAVFLALGMGEQVRGALPKDERKMALATLAAQCTGHARSWGAVEKGTFAAEAAELLSAEEEAVYYGGLSEDELAAKVAKYQLTIDEYRHVKDKSARAGVERATEERDAAIETLTTWRSAHAKLTALAAKYDARVEAESQLA